MADFVQALLHEVSLRTLNQNSAWQTVYMGGGTPTLLSETYLEQLMKGLHERLDLSAVKEWTCEVNPRTVTPAKADLMRQLGISRISLGIQAWDEQTLTTLGRDHHPEDAEETFHLLRAAGFPSISLDLMFSIPGQSLLTWKSTLEKTISLQPDHISAYNLNYEEDTEFFERLKQGRYQLEEEKDAEFFFAGLDALEAAGYEHYEISNYARPGHRSVHNEAYWLGKDYIGIGPGAYTTQNQQRWKNVENTTLYIQSLKDGRLPSCEVENLSAEDRRVERFGLELRTLRGLPRSLIHSQEEKQLQTLIEEGLITLTSDHICLTREGKPLVDAIAVSLMG